MLFEPGECVLFEVGGAGSKGTDTTESVMFESGGSVLFEYGEVERQGPDTPWG